MRYTPPRLAPRVVLMLGLSFAVASSACATSTTLEHVWRAPGWDGSFTHVLILGISKEAGVRRDFETKIGGALAEVGVAATPAFELLSEHDTELRDDEIAQILAEHGIDGVLVARVVGVDKQRRYVGGSRYVVVDGYPGAFYDYYDYYHYGYDVIHSPGYTTEYEVVTLETDLYAVSSAELVWAGLSETFAPSSVEDTIASYSKTVIAALLDANLVTPTVAPKTDESMR